MKKRSLSLFLALLMVLGSVLPVFASDVATETLPGTDTETEEKQEPTLTYEDLYVDGAVFVWDASDKTTEDTIDFGEETSIVLAENGDMQLILTKPTDGTAVYGNGYLEVTDSTSNAQLELTNVYTNAPAEVDDAYSYTTQAVIALLPYVGETTPIGFKQDYFAFANSQASIWSSYAMRENAQFIDATDAVLYNALSKAYVAAKNDTALQASFRTPISASHYEALAAMEDYAAHVFVVNGTDEDATNNPCADYSITGYEADWTAFAYIMADGTMARSYVIEKNTDNAPNILQGGVAKTVINTGTWVTDRDWKGTVGSIWTAKREYEPAVQTRINTATKLADKYQYDSAIYVDLTNAVTASKSHTSDPGTAGNGTTMSFGAGLDARFYGIRIYADALTEDELAQNLFADLCKINKVDLAKLEAIGEDGRTELMAACADMDLVADNKAAIEALADEMIATGDESSSEGPSEGAGEEGGDEEIVATVYDALYVDGAIYRWDAYSGGVLVGEDGTLTLVNRDGDAVLTMTGATYNAEKKAIVTSDGFDFSALVARDENGVYVNNELEFELVMTQISYDGTESTSNRPYLLLGPANQIGSGAKMSAENAKKQEKGEDPKHTNILSYGGYQAYYYGYRSNKANANGIATTTYYFDAEGNKVDAAVDGGSSVNVPYYTKTTGVQICTQDWSGFTRYVGNYVGESYSIGGQIAFDAANYDMSLKLVRDAKIAASYSNISYVPGYGADKAGTKIVPNTYEEALAMAERHAALNSNEYTVDSGTFKIAGAMTTNIEFAYHAFRLYDRALNDAERLQNHFADLCAYYQIENVDAFTALNADSKAALYARFSSAVIDSRDEVSNTSFEDVTKEELEKAIADQAAAEVEAAKNALYDTMYVSGYSAFWNAYFKANGAAASDNVLTISGGEAVYTDGYLRALGSTLTIADAYGAAPEDGKTAAYTTEMIYATVDAERTRTYTGGAKYNTAYGPIFGQKISDTFTTWALSEALTYTDAAGKAMQEAWGSAYLAAENDEALKAAFWTPISEKDYNSMIAIEEQKNNVRAVGGDTGVDPVGTYSTTGYEANWEGFQYVLSSSGLNRKNYYHGYNYASSNKPGIGNSYIMKSDINNLSGGWYANPDFDNWGPEKGSWSRYDFGVVTKHTWYETITNNAGTYSLTYEMYGDTQKITGATKTAPKVGSSFTVKAFDADYYAIRIYPFVLTAEQTAQNHFADLANYTRIANAEAYLGLSAEGKAALHAQFADTDMNGDKAELKTALETAVQAMADKEAAFAALNVSAETFFAFEGYQVSIWSAPAMRANFSLKDFDIEGVTLKEIGMAYAFGGGDPMTTVVYDGTNYANVKEADGARYATLEIAFAKAAEQTKLSLSAEFNFSAYVIITYEGIDFRMECDMTSESFGDGVSMYELSCHKAVADLENSELVRAIVEAE